MVKSYFEIACEVIDDELKGTTKDKQLKKLKRALADSITQTKMTVDGWDATLAAWKKSIRYSILHLIGFFLLGICWGMIIFA